MEKIKYVNGYMELVLSHAILDLLFGIIFGYKRLLSAFEYIKKKNTWTSFRQNITKNYYSLNLYS